MAYGSIEGTVSGLRGSLSLLKVRGKKQTREYLKKGLMYRPGFSPSYIRQELPEGCELVKTYRLSQATVKIYRSSDGEEGHYYLIPDEYGLNDRVAILLEEVINSLRKHRPDGVTLSSVGDVRRYVELYSSRKLRSVAAENGIAIGGSRGDEDREVQRLSRMIARYTAGLGVLEHLLEDTNIQDIYADAPASDMPVYVSMDTLGGSIPQTCRTNILLGTGGMDRIVSKLKLESGRAFSEAMPVLECDIDLYNARFTAIRPPLSPGGVGLAIRRHSTAPWTLTRLLVTGSISSLAAGLLSLLVDGNSAVMVAGSRGAGKTSILSAMMLEIPRGNRIITIEDTPELPVREMRDNSFKVQSLVVGSTSRMGPELSAAEALKVSLRLGESALVIGEVRSEEAKTLYEAMRVGSAGSSVMGTFHADSTRGVYRRIVNDMGIPHSSFLATDAVVIASHVRSKGSAEKKRKVIQISEVDKSAGGEEDAFKDLMEYSHSRETLVATDTMRYSSTLLYSIARKWGVSLEDIVEEVKFRGMVKKHLAEGYKRTGNPNYLGVKYTVVANAILRQVKSRWYGTGGWSERAFNEWSSLFNSGGGQKHGR